MKNERLVPLPIDEFWPQIQDALSQHQNLVIVAEPGAGKTTRFPTFLLRATQTTQSMSQNKKILMLEPRRLAARASASRIAAEQGWELGGPEVGYQVRFDHRTTPQTRLEVLTEGLLAQRLRAEPDLSSVGAVILDEFHERSQHTDLALGLLFELQQLARPDLRIIVMSATLDADRVASYLNSCPIVRVPGRTHPVEVRNGKKPLSLETGPGFLDEVAKQIIDVISGASPRLGDVLVFLPGAREIRGVRERIETIVARHGGECFELHGSLPLEEQERAIRALPGKTKIILSTNIAETSLTIDGVGTVIDSGLARVVRVDGAGFNRLQVSRISLASARQRTGRAGRQGPGISYRLWSKLDEASMPEFEQPELLRTDITDAMLTLLSQNVTEPEGFSWFETPPKESLRFARETLTDLGFRDRTTGALTREGRAALQLPLSARLARLVMEALRAGALSLGADMAALISEKDFVLRSGELKRQAAIESDICLRLHLLHAESEARTAIDPAALRNVRRVSDAIEKSAKRLQRPNEGSNASPLSRLSGDELVCQLLLLAYPDRLCRRRRPQEPAARMVGGRGVTLSTFSSVEKSELFLAIDSTESASAGARKDVQISIASRVERDWIKRLFPQSIARYTEVAFDSETLTVQKTWAESFHDLPLEEPHLSRPTSDEAFAVLLRACEERWQTHFLQQNQGLQRVLSRLYFLQSQEIAELDLSSVRSQVLEEVCFGETRMTEILQKPLGEVFIRHLSADLRELLNESAPDSIQVPSGSRIPVQYPEERPPFLEVRIQEIFGLRESPRIANGKVPIVFHLLGPNYRPVQVTADLSSFWKNGYVEVRKELRARYPKHSWPDDPLTATPEAKGRRRQ